MGLPRCFSIKGCAEITIAISQARKRSRGGGRVGVSNSETNVKAQSLQRSVQRCRQTLDLSVVNTTTLKNRCRQVALMLKSWI